MNACTECSGAGIMVLTINSDGWAVLLRTEPCPACSTANHTGCVVPRIGDPEFSVNSTA